MLKGLALRHRSLAGFPSEKWWRRNGKRLPEKDDEFTVTSQVQSLGNWVNHPLDETLRKTPGSKLRNIPVRLLFDDPDLNLRANYSLFDRTTGRPMCVGNGETCRRRTSDGVQTLPCPSPDSLCAGVRWSVQTLWSAERSPSATTIRWAAFVFRTTGYQQHPDPVGAAAVFPCGVGRRAVHPAAGTSAAREIDASGHRAAIYYVDLTVRPP